MTKPADDEGGESAPAKPAPDAAGVAGKRFASAVTSGDGAAVAAAFKTLMAECQGGDEPAMEDDE